MSQPSWAAATDGGEIYYQFARLQTMTEWWQWMLLVLICAAIMVFVGVVYRRDTGELSPGVRWLLFSLRVLGLAGLLFFFLDLERRSERRVVKNSRLALLIDTSQSMALPAGELSSGDLSESRLDRVVQSLGQDRWLQQLRREHDVLVYRFDNAAVPAEVASFPRLAPPGDPERGSDGGPAALPAARVTGLFAAAALSTALIAGLVFLIGLRRRGAPAPEATSWSLLVSVMSLIVGIVLVAVLQLRFPDLDWRELLKEGGQLAERASPAGTSSTTASAPLDEPSAGTPEVIWADLLKPRGMETRIGDAVRYLVNKERGGPMAGVVLITDGAHNSGIDPADAISSARQANIPVYTVGLGSAERPMNVRVVDLEAPQRVYPGDRFTMTGYLQSYGLSGRTVKVELHSVRKGPEDAAVSKFEEERRVRLGADGELQALRFETTPDGQGEREYIVKVQPPEQDYDTRDNEKRATVQVVERRTRVLLLAGGPARDFQFLRNMLYRDRDTEVDVCLQSGRPGISQEADELLYEFPKTADELFAYDAIVAFDPDWEALDERQTELLERWVADQAGGLIVLAGPVHTPQWASRVRADPRLETIQALYPVVFYSRGSATLSLGRFGSTTPWPLQFTRDGLESEFLWLADDPLGNEQAWSSFPGVFGYYAVKDVKPGARIYARFSDPDTSLDGEQPVYMAGQFYGAGRVFFMASGELWRLRGVDEKYFESFYTKLIRWVSQGRLLRDSSRGVLLVDRERCMLGDQVQVRAMLTDPQHQPLQDETVSVLISHEDGSRLPLALRKLQEAARGGMYVGEFTAQKMGDYRIELKPPDGKEDELLVRSVRVLAPQVETERPERNDALLKELAEKTGGQYFVGIEALQGGGRAGLAQTIEPQAQVTYLPGTPDRDFEGQLMGWLMGLMGGVFCLEWLVRRWNRLA